MECKLEAAASAKTDKNALTKPTTKAVSSVDTPGISFLMSLSLNLDGKHVAAVNVSKPSAVIFGEPDEVKADGVVTFEDGKIGGFLTVTIPNPMTERAGKWQCQMSALNVFGQPVHAEAEVDVGVREITMDDIVSELSRIKTKADKTEKDQQEEINLLKDKLQNQEENQQIALDNQKNIIEAQQQEIVAMKGQIAALSKSAVFFAICTSSINVTNGNVLIFDKAEVNIENVYNPGTGAFKAPFSGIFQFNVQVTNSSGRHVDLNVRKNQNTTLFNLYRYSATLGYESTSNSGVVKLQKGDVVDVVAGYYGANLYTEYGNTLTFSGTLIKAMD